MSPWMVVRTGTTVASSYAQLHTYLYVNTYAPGQTPRQCHTIEPARENRKSVRNRRHFSTSQRIQVLCIVFTEYTLQIASTQERGAHEPTAFPRGHGAPGAV